MKKTLSDPKVSVITACFNSRDFLEDAIKSVSGQTYSNIEHIVIDGDSTDGSAGIFDKYRNRIDKLLVEKDNGVFDAMNKGISLATGEIIYFLNSDDRFFDKRVVEKVVNIFINKKEIDFVYGNLVVFDPDSGASYVERYPEKISKRLFINKTIGHPASFFRTSCFKDAGIFDERYKIAADYEWFLHAIFNKGLKGVHIGNNISIFRLGGNSTNDKNMKLYFCEKDLIQRKYFNNLELLYARIMLCLRSILGRKLCRILRAARTRYERF